MVFLDDLCAFDTIPRKRFLARPASGGVKEKALELIGSYLQQRTQYINVDHGTSGEIDADCCFLQGGTIVPALFMANISDLLYSRAPYEQRIRYADGTRTAFRFKSRVWKKSIEETFQRVKNGRL